jgi:hypothetical protein
MTARPFGGGTSQISSRLAFSSTNTLVAPTRSNTPAAIVAAKPAAGSRAPTSNPWIASAPLAPTRPSSSVTISPCAASAPKKYPAAAMASTRMGAIEKSV